MSQITIEVLMEQAQVYASAWSLVGGVFDTGDQLAVAEEEKSQLEEMLEQFGFRAAVIIVKDWLVHQPDRPDPTDDLDEDE